MRRFPSFLGGFLMALGCPRRAYEAIHSMPVSSHLEGASSHTEYPDGESAPIQGFWFWYEIALPLMQQYCSIKAVWLISVVLLIVINTGPPISWSTGSGSLMGWIRKESLSVSLSGTQSSNCELKMQCTISASGTPALSS